MPRKPPKPDVVQQPRFPPPGPQKLDLPPRNEQERAQMQNELHDWEMRNLIYSAVHTNDPDARRRLASFLSWNLHSGLPLGPASRKWLSWVLMELSDKDGIPHLARGNAIKAEAHAALIQRLVEVMQGLPPGPVTGRLEKAAAMLNVSFGKVRGLYYSDRYRACSLILAARPGDSKQSTGK